MGKLVSLQNYYCDQPQAMADKSLLESEGIACFLTDQNNIGLNRMGLQVLDSDLERARALLTSEASPDHSENPVKCPECGSGDHFRPPSRVEVPLGILASFLPFFTPTQKRVCRACGHHWREKW